MKINRLAGGDHHICEYVLSYWVVQLPKPHCHVCPSNPQTGTSDEQQFLPHSNHGFQLMHVIMAYTHSMNKCE